MINKVTKILFYIGIVVIIFQKSPIILETKYETFRIIVYIIFGAILGLTIFNLSFKISRFLKICFLLLFLQTAVFLIMQLNDFYIKWFDLIEIAIPLSIMFAGSLLRLSEKEIINFSVVFFILTLFISGWQIYYYQADFFIHEIYTIPLKNSTGPFLLIGIATNTYLILLGQHRKDKKAKCRSIILLFSLTIGFYFTLVMRSRSSILAMLVFFILMFIKKRDYRILAVSLLLIIIAFLMPKVKLVNYILNPINSAFKLGKNINDLESFSSNRISVYREAISDIKEYPLFGISKRNIVFNRIPHNYVINKLLLYGIIGSLFFLLIYLLFAYSSLKEALVSVPTIKNMGAFIFLIPLIISMFEYTYPFGPGTANIFTFFFLF